MSEKTCSKCNGIVGKDEDNCPYCGAAVVGFSLKEWLTVMPLASKFALAGGIISIPSFLFSFGADAIILGLILVGIGFLMFLMKVGV